MSKWARMLKTSIEEEVGVVVESDVLAFLDGRSLDDSQFDNRRRINGSAIAVGYTVSTLAPTDST